MTRCVATFSFLLNWNRHTPGQRYVRVHTSANWFIYLWLGHSLLYALFFVRPRSINTIQCCCLVFFLSSRCCCISCLVCLSLFFFSILERRHWLESPCWTLELLGRHQRWILSVFAFKLMASSSEKQNIVATPPQFPFPTSLPLEFGATKNQPPPFCILILVLRCLAGHEICINQANSGVCIIA